MSDEQKLLAACVDYRAKLDALERENARLTEEIQSVLDALNLAANEGGFDEYDKDSPLLVNIISHWDRLNMIADKEIKKRERENAELLAQIEALKCKYYDVADAICRESSGPEDLCRQARELLADSGRIDWIESHWSGSWLREGAGGKEGPWHIWPGDWNKKVGSGKTIRAAIDAARKEVQP